MSNFEKRLRRSNAYVGPRTPEPAPTHAKVEPEPSYSGIRLAPDFWEQPPDVIMNRLMMFGIAVEIAQRWRAEEAGTEEAGYDADDTQEGAE